MRFQLSLLLIFATAVFATLSQIFLKRLSTALHLPSDRNPLALGAFFLKDIVLTADFFLCGIFSAAAFIFSLLALRKYDLTFYAPIVTGLFFILVNVISFFVLREKITYTKVLGTSLILIGMVIVNSYR